MEKEEISATLVVHRDVVWCIAFSPDGKLIASAGIEGVISLVDVESGEVIHGELQHKSWVRSLSFSPDSRQLASTADDKQVCLWDVRTGQELQRWDGSEAVAFYPDGKVLAAGAGKWLIRLWDVATGESVGHLEAEGPFHNTDITGLRGISPAQRETLKQIGAIEQIQNQN